MGTSKSYSASIKGQPQWGNLSSAVTSNCSTGTIAKASLGNIVSKYVRVIGGASNAGRGGSKIGGRAGIRTAKKLGHFLGAFADNGSSLEAAATEIGIGSIVGKPLNEVINQLLEHLCGPSSIHDDVAAKSAAQRILEEFALEVNTLEDFEAKLSEILSEQSIEDILIRYFGHYIFEHLSIMFYEKLVSEKGKSECDNLFKHIKDYIFERLKTLNKTNPLNSIDWGSENADRLIKNIQEDVLKIFEGYDS